MERGPVALFGTIVALGLGPAMWLGAQFGATDITPVRPPAITVDQVPAPGGVGAGAEPAEDVATDVAETEVEVEAEAEVDTPRRPVQVTTTARPAPTVERSATPTVAPPTPTLSQSAEPTPTTSATVSTSPTGAGEQSSIPGDLVLPLPDDPIGVGVTLASR
jgi:hypothetical protein